MNPIDYLVLGAIIAIVGLACTAIRKAKKAGKKCVGCPDSGTCPGHCGGCNGRCGEK